jgi:hypothetical protein
MSRTSNRLAALVLGISAAFPGAPVAAADAHKTASAAGGDLLQGDVDYFAMPHSGLRGTS